ncbi:5,10-methylenetetrahydrofolate reductase [Prochlorococcus marinus str. MU1404]|uniref:methylenetetrahydrofolate reductase n=1 Tax=Prochlorococcus marinus TaxID=1219 RepID=UPI001AD98348|nr:methylenetetrahydrofolate reductase [Prochlorococcus marinus]MBO8229323.1 methylenetetrahydrofolate reductase [Prochlorococcus marinus XMU1404]MBW3072406.1 5,10-methylenetetrahydrofolate reductase [Prochlorococcus marinus str. MU1404]MCR8544493.1 methylenetetrahydrofolate reductase [Prochlorococcus marinus CUG1432]
MKSKLQKTLEKKSKVITAELMPPRGGDPIRSLKIAQLLKDKVHAVNITDGSRAVMRMCSLAMSKLLLENGIEPVMQISCRDRNKIALQSDILGANALGIKNILCITGDSVKAGDQKDAKAVHQFESVRLLQQIQAFNKGIDPTFGELPDKKTFIYAGAAADPSCNNQRSLENRIRKKKEAGAQFIQTQMVMEKENLIDFCEKIAEPLEIPVIAGVFLLKSYKNALFINKYVPGANIPENILNRLKNAKNPLEEGIQIAAEQAQDFFKIANGIHLMAVKSEHLIPEILTKADLSLEY